MASWSSVRRQVKSRLGLWPWILKTVVLPAGDLAFGQKMMSRLRFLEQAQWWDEERLAVYRDRSLAALLKVAYEEIPFYRQLMNEARLRPEDLRSPKDLRYLPVVTKDMLRAGYPHRTIRKTGLKTYETGSSGSTGKNFYVREDSETAGWYRAAFLLSLEWAGWQIGESHLQTGMTLHRSRDRRLKDALLRCHYTSAYDLSDANLDLALEALEKHKIKHLWGYPGSLYCLARRARQKGWNQPLRSIVTWGDNLYPQYREAIEAAFQTRIFDTYGCGEGIQIAAQCGVGHIYHIHSLDVIVEYLNNDGQAVEDGQSGNLILTRLHPGPMPLIRYQVGDVGIAGDRRRCECGRGYDLLKTIQGRDTDIVVTPSGNRLIVHFFTGILEHFREIDTFQVIQQQPDSIQVRVVAKTGFNGETASRMVARLKERGADDLHIHVDVVQDIPLSQSGKRRFVISNLPRPFTE